jgi:hypothetical protein
LCKFPIDFWLAVWYNISRARPGGARQFYHTNRNLSTPKISTKRTKPAEVEVKLQRVAQKEEVQLEKLRKEGV